jgi:hypothetical protein
MRHQDAFSPPPNLGRNGLIQVQTPTETESEVAAMSLSEALDRLTSALAETAMT